MFPLRAIVWFLLALCCASSQVRAQARQADAPPKSITVVMDDNYPPFIFRDNQGQIQGILKDSWALWELRTGVAVKLLPMDWDKALQMMQDGQADVIDTIFLTEARKQIYDFGAPYAKLDVPIFFHQSISGIANANSLQGFTVGVKAGDACIDVLRTHGVDSTRSYDSYSALVTAAAAAEVRAFCADQPPAVYLLNQLGIEKEFRHSVPLYTGAFHRAVKKGNTVLLKLIEDGFARISPAEAQQIEQKWHGSAIAGRDIPPTARYTAYALLAFVLAALALTLWNLMLRRRVTAKTAELSNSLAALGQEKQITEQTLAQMHAIQGALLESEERYRMAFMTSPDAVNINRLSDGLYLDVNDGFLHMTGWTREEVSGRHSLELNVWQDQSDRKKLIHTLQRDGHCENLEANFVSKEGKVIAGLMSVHLITLKGETCILSVTRDISARKQSEDALRIAAAAFDAQEGIFVTDPARVILRVNQAFTEITGYSAEEAVGKTRRQLNANRHSFAFNAAIVEGVAHHGKWQGEVSNQRKSGEAYTEWLTVSAVLGSHGKISHYVGTLTDISARKAAQEELKLAASVFTHAREGIMITQADGAIVNVNESFSRITGFRRDEVVGRNPRLLKSGLHSEEFYRSLWLELIGLGQWSGEIWNRRKNGENYPQTQTISTVFDEQGKPVNYVALFSDITAQKAQQRQLEHLAHFDALTNLPNRVLLADRLQQAMAHAQRRSEVAAVVYLDLDGFKAINDRHGHDIGNQLLITLASRMKQALREADTLARIGGDEFVAVLMDLGDIAASVPMLNRLLAAAAQAAQLGDILLQVSASAGVTFYPQSQDIDADQLLRQADQAMYQAKLAGKNRFHFFDTEQDSSIRGHHASLVRIQQALARHEFVLYYQPKVNMRSGAVIGAEALIRWQHPEQGLLPPALFLPTIEDHPLATEIGEWVIDSALTQIERWRVAGLDIPVSVNLGARQLQQTDFAARLRDLLAAHPRVGAGALELEVLETSALEDIDRVAQLIDACAQLGVGFALDDFGTGYSSLTYLKHLRVTLLKIDRSFVRNMLDDPDDLAILEGVIGLASAFRCQVIAEGVESVAHGTLLLQLGCELAQGFGIAHPMPATDLPAWVRSWCPDPTWVDRARVRRDDLPLLRAGVECRAWISNADAFFKGEREAPPALNLLHDSFDQLRSKSQVQPGMDSFWQTIEALHQRVLKLNTGVLQSQASGNPAPAHPDDLHGLRDLMLRQLTSMDQETRPSDL